MKKKYPKTAAPPKDAKRRFITGAEMELLHYMWGNYLYLVVPPWAMIYDAEVQTSRGPMAATGLDIDGVVKCYVNSTNSLGLVHEVGHAIQLLRYEDGNDWPKWKGEAFALLADARAMKHKKGLSPETRKAYADRIRYIRNHASIDHYKGLQLAWKAVWSSKKLNEQMEYIVGSTHA